MFVAGGNTMRPLHNNSADSPFASLGNTVKTSFAKFYKIKFFFILFKMQTAEVNGRSTQCKTKENTCDVDNRVGEVYDEVDAGAVHNPTIHHQAEELTEVNGKRSFRTILSTFWCDTIEERNAEFERVIAVWPTAKYILFGPLETTEENKKNHCHCIFAFASSKLWKTIIKTLSCEKYHHEKCRNFNNAREYCLKTDPTNGLEYGKPLKQGARSDINELLQKNNYNVVDIRNNDPALYSRYRNGILDVCKDKQDDDEILSWLDLSIDDNGEFIDNEYKPAEVYWYCGSTGTGKSRNVKSVVRDILKNKQYELRNISIIHKIENGFAIGTIRDKTKVLILDEFRGSSMKFSDLLALIDGCSINVKGGKQWIKADKIFITSCYSPDDCYPNLGLTDSINQLHRRITKLVCFNNEEE